MNNPITKETIAAARAARERGYVTRTEGATSMAATECIENRHFDTLAELCRQQHEALKSARINTVLLMESAYGCYVEEGVAVEDIDAPLALWPDDPTEEARDHEAT